MNSATKKPQIKHRIYHAGNTLAIKSFTILNPAYIYLKAYYELHGQSKDLVTWLPSDHCFLKYNVERCVAEILNHKPTIVALSLYIWNEIYQLAVAKALKEHSDEEIKIVVGGPHVQVHQAKNFFESNPYVDYLVFGDGEKAFTQIVDSIVHNKQVIPVNTFVNDNLNISKGLYEPISDQLYKKTSPILIQKNFVVEQIKRARAQLGTDYNLFFSMEFARGCMYQCSFCDWNSGLSERVYRKEYDFKEEISFFKEIDIPISTSDANFGQWKEDMDIFRYANSLYDPKGKFRFFVSNVPKLKKNVAFEILQTNSNLYGLPPKLALQDIDKKVLTNINRPEIDWSKHKEFIRNLRSNISKEQHICYELILGLPGQTRESIIKTIYELAELGVTFPKMYFWEFLPNSPANNNNYMLKHKLEVFQIYTMSENFYPEKLPSYESPIEMLDQIYNDLATQSAQNLEMFNCSRIIVSPSMSLTEMISLKYFQTILYTREGAGAISLLKSSNKRGFLDNLHDESMVLAKSFYEKHYKYFEKFGFLFLISDEFYKLNSKHNNNKIKAAVRY
jgi:tRNA A37 methylthiotransferase MiaB